MERIRVLRVITRMNVGGPARQTVGLAGGLDPEVFDQRLLAGRGEPDEADYLELAAKHIEVGAVPGLRRLVDPVGDVRALNHLVREIRQFRPHIVHTHLAKAGVLGRLAVRLARSDAKTVHTFHGHLLYGILSPRTTRVVIAVERFLAPRTARLVSVGARVRDELVAAGIGRPDQYTVVPPGVDLPAAPSAAEARARLGLPGGGQVVVMLARLTAQKRPERYVELARQVCESRSDVVFALAGGGELESSLRAQAADLGDRFRFLGWRADVEVVIAAADVVVLTSDNEGMPVALIEAGLVGRAAIATDVGSTAEVIADGETGFVTSTDVGDMAEALERLLDNPELRRSFEERAAKRAHRLFSKDRLVADIDALYRALVETPQPGRR